MSSKRRINLRTRDWVSRPWGTSEHGDSYAPPSSLIRSRSVNPTSSSSYSSGGRATSSFLGVYPEPLSNNHTSQLPSSSSTLGPTPYSASANYEPTTYSLPQGGFSSYGAHSGLPSSNYTPSSTIPLQHNYHLPSSNLAHSSGPYDAQLSKNFDSSSGQQQWGQQQQQQFNAPLNKYSGIQNSGQSNIPQAPPMPNWNRNRSYRSRSRPMRRLRTRDWGWRTEHGWTGFNWRPAVEEAFLRNRARPAPEAPPVPSFFRQRKWMRGPYKQRNLRTRNWGLRSENGWNNFNRGIYAHESALPL